MLLAQQRTEATTAIELCPLCGGPSRRVFSIAGYGIDMCSLCGHRFANIARHPDDVAQSYGDCYFTGGGAGYLNYLRNADILREHGRRYAAILARYSSPGNVLDVGSAAGFILAGLRDAGWAGLGLEPNASMAAFGRRQLDLTMVESTLEEYTNTSDEFDVVTMIQVIAHFFDVKRALGVAARVTKLGGLWLFETWDWESFTARLLGRHWHEYSPPSVRNIFSLRGLDAFVARFGFQPIARGRPKKYVLGEHLKSLLDHKARESWFNRAVLGFARCIPDDVKVAYPANDLFWRLYKKTDSVHRT